MFFKFDRKAIEKETKEYIKKYLKAGVEWHPDCDFESRWDDISYIRINWHEVACYINEMKYSDFLDTLYWKTISERKKRMANYRCELCTSLESLVTHHSTYFIRGYELLQMENLIVLCGKCHKKFHNKK